MPDIIIRENNIRKGIIIMRIESYSQVQQVYDTKTSSGKVEAVKPVVSSDQLDISNMGKNIQSTKQVVENVPDVREDLVASLKERMENGTYQVSPESFADKLIQAYEQSDALYK